VACFVRCTAQFNWNGSSNWLLTRRRKLLSANFNAAAAKRSVGLPQP
jgi:hypothetical protein